MPEIARRSLFSRRGFVVGSAAAIAAVPTVALAKGVEPSSEFSASMDYELVKKIVGFSHGNEKGVRELIEKQPELAKAAWDWGFGDVESAIGAASHVGNRAIAELLLANGARPTLFTFAMMGDLEVVRATVEAHPGIVGNLGPHGFTLAHHARMGGDRASAVAEYLSGVDGADESYAREPVENPESYMGRYVGVDGTTSFVDLEKSRFAPVALTPEGGTTRSLIHKGEGVFHPIGAPSVRIVISGDGLSITMGGEVTRFVRV